MAIRDHVIPRSIKLAQRTSGQEMPLFRLFSFSLAVAQLLVICGAAPSHAADAKTPTVRDRSKCVSPAYDRIGEDVSPGQLIYDHSKDDSDDEYLFKKFKNDILSSMNDRDQHTDEKEKLYAMFSVAFHFNRGPYRQLATAIICRQQLNEPDNECRNRTYFSFMSIGPDEWADIILGDIVRTEPTIQVCPF